jgi:hypothetical protein
VCDAPALRQRWVLVGAPGAIDLAMGLVFGVALRWPRAPRLDAGSMDSRPPVPASCSLDDEGLTRQVRRYRAAGAGATVIERTPNLISDA